MSAMGEIKEAMDEIKDFFSGSSSSRAPEPRREEQAEPGGRSYNLPPLQPSTTQAQRVVPTPPTQASVPTTVSEPTEDRPQETHAAGERASNPYSSTATNGTSNASLGLPILSGPPSYIESEECRTCGKNFIPIFRKAHNCAHCGYSYCSDHCEEHGALMPRQGLAARQAPGSNTVGAGPRGGGYEMVEVCHNCFPMLQIASSQAAYLRTLPLKRLQQFIKAYNLNPAAVSAIEKEDFVQLILKAKDPRTGTMPREAESFYRRRSVPKQGVIPPVPATTNARPAPSVRPTPQPARSTRPPTTATTPSARPTPPPSQQQYPRPPGYQAPGPGYQARPTHPFPRPAPSTPRPAASSQSKPTPIAKRTPSPPVPMLSSLVPLPMSYIASLPIGTLKAILLDNHVKVDFAQVLEKGELIARVQELIKMERKRLERIAKEEEAEAAAREAATAGENAAMEADQMKPEAETGESAPPRVSTDVKQNPPTGPPPAVERDGLCVVCQDQDAELAVVDCGHLSMCQDCSKLVMSTSRECPLCRTRIITGARLIRIFRT